jgi:hypothetical protein
MSKARQLADLGNVYDDGALSNRNLIINGAMQVAQRGTSSTGVNYKTVDRFRLDQNTMDELAFTQSQDTDAPAGFKNSYKLTVNTPETSLVLTEWLYMRYTMEGQDAQVLQFGQSTAQKTTMSFWVKSSVTGDYAVLFFNDQGSARGQTLTYTVNAANTWEYKTIVFDGDTAQNFANSNAAGPDLYFTLSAGPDRKTTDGSSWINYTANASAYGQTADVATVNGATWQITGVQLEVGDTATPFEHRSYGDELARCQRYYFSSDEADSLLLSFGDVTSGDSTYFTILHPTTMRTGPTITLSNESHSGFDGITVFRNYATRWAGYDVATSTGRGYFQFEYVADAEL